MKIEIKPPGLCAQLRLLIKKNALLKWRSKASLMWEILTPVLIMLMLTMFRSVTSTTAHQQSLYLNQSVTLGDVQVVESMLYAVACGAQNQQGYRITDPVSFAVACPSDQLNKGMGTHIRTTMIGLMAITNFTNLTCTDEPLICLFVANKGAAQCRGPFKETVVDLRKKIMSPQFILEFESRAALEKYVQGATYGADARTPPFMFGVSFPMGRTGHGDRWEYVLHTNRTSVDSSTGGYTNDFVDGFIKSEWAKIHLVGVTFFQALVDSFILDYPIQEAMTNTMNSWLVSVQFIPFPIPNYKSDNFAGYFQAVIGLILVLAIVWPFSRFLKFVMYEKEERIKEGMKMMGMSNAAYWWSWYIVYAVQLFVTALIGCICTLPVFQKSDFGLILFMVYFFFLACLSFACMLSTFLSNSKSTAIPIGMLMASWMMVSNIGEDSSRGTRQLYCLFPGAAIHLGIGRVLQYESSFVGLTRNNLSTVSGSYAVSDSFGMLIWDIIFYALLTWYFDKTNKTQFGTSLPQCFCCLPKFWSSKCGKREMQLDSIEDELSSDVIQPVSFELQTKRGIRIRKMRKEFQSNKMSICKKKPFIAVESLDLDFYEGQVFVLLGHNGAGKSTTINLLTGMVPITSGSAIMWGKDVGTQINEVRHMIGACPQHDILFSKLTVKEHLRLYGQLKGVSEEDLEIVISQAIEEVQLEAQTNQVSGTLSGGQKRRLSLAIALIGDSKVVVLDEPTSGVDPFSRRAIWDVIQKRKAGRIIILTTHFMDEADYLGDRICIMHHGKIRCCGTSMFLKKMFGVGYNIVLNCDRGAKRDELSEMIKKHVPSSAMYSDVGTELSFKLPIASSGQFPELLKDLEAFGKELGCENFGLSVTTLEEVFLKVANEKRDDDSQVVGADVEPSQLDKPKDYSSNSQMQKPIVNAWKDMFSTNEAEISFGRQFKALFLKRLNYAKRDRKALCCQFILPWVILLFGLLLTFVNPFLRADPDDIVLTFKELNQPLQLPVNDEFSGTSFEGKYGLGAPGLFPVSMPGNYSSLEAFSLKLLEQRKGVSKESRYGAMCLNQNAKFPFKNGRYYNIFTNITARYGMPMFLSQVVNRELRDRKKNYDARVSVTLSRMAPTKSEQEAFSSFSGFFSSLFVAIAMSFVPASYLVFIVREREINAKHLQLISGMDIAAYWVSNFCFDLCTYLVTAFGIFVLVVALGSSVYRDYAGTIMINLLLFGLSVIPYSYLLSFAFKNVNTAQMSTIMLLIVTGVGLLVLAYVAYVIDDLKSSADGFRYTFRIFPNFCMGDTFFYLSQIGIIEKFTFEAVDGPYSMKVSGTNFVFMAMEAILFPLGIALIEWRYTKSDTLFGCAGKEKKVDAELETKGLDKVEDVDVEAEKNSILADGPLKDGVTLKGIRRVFPSKVAVNDLYFSIPKNQCFGFLGVNGAGKSTTLKILTGDQVPTAGDATVNGHSVLTEKQTVRKTMGYCPQFDAVHPLLSGEETLYLYGRLRGVPEAKLIDMVAYLASRLTLDQANQHKRPAATYSGGNLRKLSVGVALIGNPSVVLLDEPSTGMDPVSRRFMWDFISQTMEDRSVILTTHSMEECEALCSRIGILVHGRLRCIGPGQHLKTRFGKGFEFQLNVQEKQIEEARLFVQQTFNDVEEVECYGGNIRYKLGKQDMELSGIFGILESNKESKGIIEYAIGQSTLEQIFISFAMAGDKELVQEDYARSGSVVIKAKNNTRLVYSDGEVIKEKTDS